MLCIYTVPFTSNPLAIAMLSNVLMDIGAAVSTDAPGIETAVDVPMSVCRKSSLKLAMLRTIPHPVPPEILQAYFTGYIQQVQEVQESKSTKNLYFDIQLQTGKDETQSVRIMVQRGESSKRQLFLNKPQTQQSITLSNLIATPSNMEFVEKLNPGDKDKLLIWLVENSLTLQHSSPHLQILMISEEWKRRHPQEGGFMTYSTKYKAEPIKNNMTNKVRSMAGLGVSTNYVQLEWAKQRKHEEEDAKVRSLSCVEDPTPKRRLRLKSQEKPDMTSSKLDSEDQVSLRMIMDKLTSLESRMEDNFSLMHSQMSELRCEFKEKIDGVKVNIKDMEKSLEHAWAVIEDVQQEAKTNKDSKRSHQDMLDKHTSTIH
ncbi:hypothetical protein ACROYT_G040290 [Oculina patagonica]